MAAGKRDQRSERSGDEEPTEKRRSVLDADCRKCRGFNFYENGAPGCAEHVVRFGFPVDARYDLGMTSLHFAADEDDAGGIKALLGAGANLESTDCRKATPLHYAARRRNPECLDLLLRAGANCNARDHAQRTPLHMAAICGSGDCVKLLFHAGAHIEATDWKGCTPLCIAISYAHAHAARLLLRAGADVFLPGLCMPSDEMHGYRIRDFLEELLNAYKTERRMLPLLAASARGELLGALPRLYDPAIWRVVARFARGQ